jgi:hypothetical protein
MGAKGKEKIELARTSSIDFTEVTSMTYSGIRKNKAETPRKVYTPSLAGVHDDLGFLAATEWERAVMLCPHALMPDVS